MIEFKACPRCGGDVKHAADMYGEYKECLQCGRVVDIDRRAIDKFPNWRESARKVGGKRRAA